MKNGKKMRKNKKYTGSGFRNLDLIEKYSGDDKRVIEEYGLE